MRLEFILFLSALVLTQGWECGDTPDRQPTVETAIPLLDFSNYDSIRIQLEYVDFDLGSKEANAQFSKVAEIALAHVQSAFLVNRVHVSC